MQRDKSTMSNNNPFEEHRTEEERIIDNLVVEGKRKLYEDLDFIPARQSLYNSEKLIPEYDDEVFQQITYVIPSFTHCSVNCSS